MLKKERTDALLYAPCRTSSGAVHGLQHGDGLQPLACCTSCLACLLQVRLSEARARVELREEVTREDAEVCWPGLLMR